MQFSAERSEDGTVRQIWVDHFDDEVLIALALLEKSDPRFLRRDGDEFTILAVRSQDCHELAAKAASLSLTLRPVPESRR